MFDELEKQSQNKEIDHNKTFIIEGITNQEIGTKIKSFAKIFLKIEISFLIIGAIGTLVGALSADDAAIMVLLAGAISIFVVFIVSYFGFLVISGFGALIEDINAIKTMQEKKKEK